MHITCPLTPDQRATIAHHEREVVLAEHQRLVAKNAQQTFYSHILAAHVLTVARPAGDPNVTTTDAGLCFDVPELPQEPEADADVAGATEEGRRK